MTVELDNTWLSDYHCLKILTLTITVLLCPIGFGC